MKELYSAHLGNGLVVWRHGEDKWIAHISANRDIHFYEPVTKQEQKHIEYLAKTDDRNISQSQDIKVFNTRPK